MPAAMMVMAGYMRPSQQPMSNEFIFGEWLRLISLGANREGGGEGLVELVVPTTTSPISAMEKYANFQHDRAIQQWQQLGQRPPSKLQIGEQDLYQYQDQNDDDNSNDDDDDGGGGVDKGALQRLSYVGIADSFQRRLKKSGTKLHSWVSLPNGQVIKPHMLEINTDMHDFHKLGLAAQFALVKEQLDKPNHEKALMVLNIPVDNVKLHPRVYAAARVELAECWPDSSVEQPMLNLTTKFSGVRVHHGEFLSSTPRRPSLLSALIPMRLCVRLTNEQTQTWARPSSVFPHWAVASSGRFGPPPITTCRSSRSGR